MKRLIASVLSCICLSSCLAPGVDVYEVPECTPAFAPTFEMSALTDNAITRWSAALGCEIVIDEDNGTPIFGTDYIEPINQPDPPAGYKFSRLLGRTSTHYTNGVLDSVNYVAVVRTDSLAQMEKTVMHEMAHAMGLAGHVGEGLGATPSTSNFINQELLDVICLFQPCNDPTPEVP